MMYQGGKSRIALTIAQVIKIHAGRGTLRCLVSLFCGSCAVESKLTYFQRRICNDKQPYLIELLKGVQSGYDLPDTITEEEYQRVRNNKDADKVLTGFVGFGCSFGGKWFCGYARNNCNKNYASVSRRSLMKDMETLQDVEFINKDYRDVELPDGCVIYADPPYANTTGYNNEDFDSAAFWEYARDKSKSHLMYISEQTAPEDFVAIWQTPSRRTLDVNKDNKFMVVEKLFVHKSNIGNYKPMFGEQLTLFDNDTLNI